MSLKKVSQVKVDKGFKIWDLIIYGAVLVLVAALFIAVFTTRDTSPLSGVRVSVRDGVLADYKTVFEYNFNDAPTFDGETVEVQDKDGVLTVTVHTHGDGINVVVIDKKARTAKVTEANCRSRRCVQTAAIKDNSSDIHCATHGLKVEPFSYNPDDPFQPV